MALLAGEITARAGKDPAQVYKDLTGLYGEFFYRRQDAPCTPAMQKMLKTLAPERVTAGELAGDRIESARTTAPANNEPLGGIKVAAAGGWFAARPSGTEPVYKIYAESFRSEAHLGRIFTEAEEMIKTLSA
jgi:phosphoglucomutase